jgi:hypothetical protein
VLSPLLPAVSRNARHAHMRGDGSDCQQLGICTLKLNHATGQVCC